MKSLKLLKTTGLALIASLLASSVLADPRKGDYYRNDDRGYHGEHRDYRHHDYRNNYDRDSYSRHHHHRELVRERIIYAPVTYARPIYRTVAVDVPVDSCRVETTRYRQPARGDSFGGTVVGGLIGAAIGNEIGHGGGRSTAVGGLIGAAIGNDMARGGATRYEDREVCSTSYRTEYRQEVVAYDVGYSYDGRVYHTERHNHPGAQIRLDINLSPY